MNLLAQQIDELNQNLAQQVPPEVLNHFKQSIEDLKNVKREENCIKIGATFPNFKLKNTANQWVELDDLLQKGSVIISFFRGSWCPYCNLELRALQRQLSTLHDKNTTLLAISPQLSPHNERLKENLELEFEILTDQDNQLAQQLGLAFELPDYVIPTYESLGIQVSKYNGTKHHELPIPAVFAVDTTGRITYAFVETNYMIRVDIEELISLI